MNGAEFLLLLMLLSFLAGLILGLRLKTSEAKSRIAYLTSQLAQERPHAAAKPTREDELLLILAELDRAPFAVVLSEMERATLKHSYEAMLVAPHAPTRPPIPATSGPVKLPAPTRIPLTTVTSPPKTVAPIVTAVSPEPPSTPGPTRERGRRIQAAFDPAIMLLYLGGLLVVAAGLIYASYSWATLGPWQKMSLLIAATSAFLLAGIILSRHERVRQAGETYIAIGCMLVPTNGIAAFTMIEGAEARPELPLFFAALATALVHGAFSIRPGGVLYTYGAVIAAAIALGTLPTTLGMEPAWAAPAFLLGVALIPAPSGSLAHLAHAYDRVSIIGMGLVLILLIATSDAWLETDRWLIPATFAALALALLRFDRLRSREDGSLAALASLAVTCAVVSAVRAAHIDDFTARASVGLMLTAAFTLATVYGPDFFRRPLLRAVMTLQIVFTAWFPVAFFLADERAWAVSLACLAGFAFTALAAASYRSRWLLFFSGLHLCAFFFSILGFVDTSDWTNEDSARFMMIPPLVIAALAWALDRSGRDIRQPIRRLGLPVWVLTALMSALTILFGFSLDDRLASETLRFAATLGMLAVTALVAAWSMDAPIVRYLFGTLGIAAIGTALEPANLAVLDLATAFVASLALFTIPSAPPVANALGKRVRVLRPLARPAPPNELIVIGATMAAVLILMLGATLLHIGSGAAGDLMSLDTSAVTWPLYLLIFAILACASLSAGWKLPQAMIEGQRSRLLVAWTIAWSLVTVALATRMLTTDLVIWAWVAMGAGIAMVVAPILIYTRNGFLRSLIETTGKAGVVIGYLGLAADIGLAFGVRPQHDAGQVAFFAITAMVLVATSRSGHLSPLFYHGIAALGLAIPFGMRALERDLPDTALAFTAFAWFLAFSGALGTRTSARAWLRQHLVNSALAAQAVGIGLALPDAVRSADGTYADIANAIAWASLAVLLAIEGTRVVDARRTLLALLSGIPAVMATSAAFDGDRFAMSLNLVVYGWLAIGTLIGAQRTAPQAWPRRHGMETGMAANIIALAIPVVSLTGTMRQDADPALVLGLVSMAGMLAVDAYLRADRMRAVLATMFGMAALLYQIDSGQPSDIHAYTVPLAIYLLTLGYLFRRHPAIEQTLMAIGAGTLVVPTLMTALDEGTFRWLLIAGSEGFALLFGGMLTRLRVPIAAGVLTISILVLRMTVDAVNALPSWVTLLLAGVALLILGTLWLTFRDALKERFGHARKRWAHLG